MEDAALGALRRAGAGGPRPAGAGRAGPPGAPFGGPLGLRCGIDRRIADADLASRLDVARVRRARLIAPVDAPRLDEADWALLAGLNDLLAHQPQRSPASSRAAATPRLATNLAWLCERIPAPRDIEGTLSRHATFARALEIGAHRLDGVVVDGARPASAASRRPRAC